MCDDLDLDKDEMIKLTALNRAIQSGAGTRFDGTADADKVIEAATKFENYLKGNVNVKPD